MRAAAAFALLAVAVAGCTSGLGQLQTASTLPPGQVRSTISTGWVQNEHNDERDNNMGSVIVQYAVRAGVREHLDLGLKTFLGLGLLADAKVQVVDRRRLVVSLLGGMGGALDVVSEAKVIHVPVMLLASYQVASFFTPYVAAGYGAFWILGYEAEHPGPPGSTPVGRDWHGDGVLMLHAGVELGLGQRLRLMLEYGHLRPVVDDPGDSYGFVTNHIVTGGLRF